MMWRCGFRCCAAGFLSRCCTFRFAPSHRLRRSSRPGAARSASTTGRTSMRRALPCGPGGSRTTTNDMSFMTTQLSTGSVRERSLSTRVYVTLSEGSRATTSSRCLHIRVPPSVVEDQCGSSSRGSALPTRQRSLTTSQSSQSPGIAFIAASSSSNTGSLGGSGRSLSGLSHGSRGVDHALLARHEASSSRVLRRLARR